MIAAKRATTIDREITDHAIDFIKRKAKTKKPFFAYLPYTQTHEPVDAHPDFKGKTGNGSFADVLAQTDATWANSWIRLMSWGSKTTPFLSLPPTMGAKALRDHLDPLESGEELCFLPMKDPYECLF